MRHMYTVRRTRTRREGMRIKHFLSLAPQCSPMSREGRTELSCKRAWLLLLEYGRVWAGRVWASRNLPVWHSPPMSPPGTGKPVTKANLGRTPQAPCWSHRATWPWHPPARRCRHVADAVVAGAVIQPFAHWHVHGVVPATRVPLVVQPVHLPPARLPRL